MSNEEWWAAERKAAGFWRKIKENQMRSYTSYSLNHGTGAAPIARPAASVARLLAQTARSQPAT